MFFVGPVGPLSFFVPFLSSLQYVLPYSWPNSFICCKIHPTCIYFFELVNNYMSSAFASFAGCSEAKLFFATITVINGFGQIPAQVQKDPKRQLLEANKREPDAGGRVRLQLIGIFTSSSFFLSHFSTVMTGETVLGLSCTEQQSSCSDS